VVVALAMAALGAVQQGQAQARYEYTPAMPDFRSPMPMGYGHVRQPAGDPGRCTEHPWREYCGPCSVQAEDILPTGSIASRLRSIRGTW
jgi:hypothetical protein